MKKPRTDKQVKSWQICYLRGVINNIKQSDIITKVDKDIIISLLNNSIIRQKARDNIKFITLPCDYNLPKSPIDFSKNYIVLRKESSLLSKFLSKFFNKDKADKRKQGMEVLRG